MHRITPEVCATLTTSALGTTGASISINHHGKRGSDVQLTDVAARTTAEVYAGRITTGLGTSVDSISSH